jgi:hypothetical protein
MVRRNGNAALKVNFIVKCCHMSLYRRMGVGVGRQKGQDEQQCNSAAELCYSSRVATCHRNRKGRGNYSYLYEFVKLYSSTANNRNAVINYELNYTFGDLFRRSDEQGINI